MKRPGSGLFNAITKTGKGRRSTKKCGFATKKEVLEWEREFLKSTCANMDMMLGAFVDVYFGDKAGELKECTIKNKCNMVEARRQRIHSPKCRGSRKSD